MKDMDQCESEGKRWGQDFYGEAGWKKYICITGK